MFRIVFILTLLFSGLSCSGQGFAPVGTQWFYLNNEAGFYEDQNGIDMTKTDCIFFESVADTLILGKTCQKIDKYYIGLGFNNLFPDNSPKKPPVHEFFYVLNENNKVYFYKYNKFNLMYDFNAKVGDTIGVYDYIYYPSSTIDDPDTMGMNEITEIILGDFGNVKRKIFFSKQTENSVSGECGYFLPVIDQVGGERFFYPTSNMLEQFDPTYLWCYYQNEVVYDRGKGYCAHWIDFVAEQKAKAAKEAVVSIKFYPNPIEGISKLVFPNMEEQTHYLTIYNCLGESVMHLQSNDYYFELNKEDFANGIYHYLLEDSEHKIISRDKFLSF